MNRWMQKVVTFLKQEDGPTAVEYAVMLALIIVVCLVAITTLGQQVNNTFSNVGNKLQAAMRQLTGARPGGRHVPLLPGPRLPPTDARSQPDMRAIASGWSAS